MISVVICSHNGERTLPLTLEAMAAVDTPAAGVEYIGVDNASSDRTAAIFDAHRGTLPLTVLSEPRKGKCFALNRAIDRAAGDLVVFADDDVIPERQWLKAFEAAAAAHPDADLFAGQVRHHWLAPAPDWQLRLAEEGRSCGGTPADQPEGPVTPGFFKGANFMVRRKVLEATRFSEDEGLNFGGNALAGGGEDTAFVKQAVAGGAATYYVPGASVRHIVRPHEIGLLPVLRRYVRIGRAMVMNSAEPADLEVAHILGYPRFVFRTIPVEMLRAGRLWLSGNPHAATQKLVDVATIWGKAVQKRKLRLAGRRK